LGEVRGILAQLEELGEEESIDWDTIIGDHPYFDGIKSTNFPPLYNESDFEDVLNGFLAIVCEPLNEMPGMTFNRLYLYLETDIPVVGRLAEKPTSAPRSSGPVFS
jgi:hypothetical protein